MSEYLVNSSIVSLYLLEPNKKKRNKLSHCCFRVTKSRLFEFGVKDHVSNSAYNCGGVYS